ncbi:glutaredoxin 3 [Moraxella caviae]|uniref:Glutaredoxin n=1 Tax=Moraxella caviae TaxID=34060 RepID=A0A1S9ZVL1_9GAMM|nr:glutaredoxin 3 [Moraxella caviae]OOR87011.1 glutaredoxin 3 [Moraxella caviae]STZ10020.1 Glutaredoxin-3 [Moraxella caviae]VEW13211.1 Glutaredoxin-3 [Moraxella caviae]
MQAVQMYIKETCSYCAAAKQLLDNKGVPYTATSVFDLSDEERAAIAAKTNNYRTVPQIFIGETFIGGYDDLRKLERHGKLDELLNA